MRSTNALALVVLLSASLVHAKDKDGVGNCVFSKADLPKGQEARYKLETSFGAGDEVHIRCYYVKPLEAYESDGKRTNTLRDGMYHARLYLRDTMLSVEFINNARYKPAESGKWNQQRFDVVPSVKYPECDFKDSDPKKRACADLLESTTWLGKKRQGTGKYTADVCVEVSYAKSDRTKLSLDRVREESVLEKVVIAQGCVRYTVEF